MITHGGRVQFLASVTSVAEARLAASNGADIIDCKDPSAGALGALPVEVVRDIAAAVKLPVSATIGDLVPEPDLVCPAVLAMAATGVDMIKAGFFPGGDARSTIRELGRLKLHDVRLVGLLLADRSPDFALIDEMADAGFAGVMLDTASKVSGSLVDVNGREELQQFVRRAHSSGLFAGLAGALRVRHIPAVAALGPDVIGFRGALCQDAMRTGVLNGEAVRSVQAALVRALEDTALIRAGAAQ